MNDLNLRKLDINPDFFLIFALSPTACSSVFVVISLLLNRESLRDHLAWRARQKGSSRVQKSAKERVSFNDWSDLGLSTSFTLASS